MTSSKEKTGRNQIKPQDPAKEPSSANQEWEALADGLALSLYNLDKNEFLILSHERANHYVQFGSMGRDGIRAEAVCNAYITVPQDKLTAEDCAMMAHLGWNKPTRTPRPKKGSPQNALPNFFQDMPRPVDVLKVAKLTVDTFRQVYRVKHPAMLRYKAFVSGGPEIEFPLLPLRPCEPD